MLSQDEVKAIVANSIRNSLGRYDTGIANARRRALQVYYGEQYGDEKEGQSKIVTSESRDTVGWLLPSLLKVFLSAPKIASFMPEQPEDEQASDQASDVINYIIMKENPGYNIFRTWFKDALMSKNGFVKYYWNDDVVTKTYRFTGLDDVAYQKLMQEPGVEIVKQEQYQEMIPDSQGGQFPVTLSNCIVNRTFKQNKICIENIAPENILMSRRATSTTDTPFMDHITTPTRSDLVAMGYDKDMIWSLPPFTGEANYNTERTTRRFVNKITTIYEDSINNFDKTTERVEVHECYIKIDEDGDGIAELRKITVAGSDAHMILDDVEVEEIPICSICPINEPHVFFGRSIVDETMDLQRINTSIMRGLLDYMYKVIHPRYEVNESMVNLDDMLHDVPGGLVRSKQVGSVSALAQPQLPPQVFDLIEKLSNMLEIRLGVSRLNQGLDPDAINKTAMGQKALMNAGKQKEEMIAREFAETGVKDLIKGVYKLFVKHQPMAKTIRLRNKWVSIDPSDWNVDMDVEINVGLGVSSTDQALQQMSDILDKQKEAIQAGSPLSNEALIYNTLSKMLAIMGYKDPTEFFVDPANLPPPSPPPPPQPTFADQAAFMSVKQMDDKSQRDYEMNKYKTDLDAELEKYKTDIDKQLRELELQFKYNIPVPPMMPDIMLPSPPPDPVDVKAEQAMLMQQQQAVLGQQQPQLQPDTNEQGAQNAIPQS